MRHRAALVAAFCLATSGASAAEEVLSDRPFLLAGGIGWQRMSYYEDFTSASGKAFKLREVFSAPAFSLLAEYGAERWTFWLSLQTGQKDPWFGVSTLVGADWLLVTWDRGSFGIGADLALLISSSKHDTAPTVTDDNYRWTDVGGLGGGVVRADHWLTESSRIELRLSFLGVPLSATRRYEEGIAPEPGQINSVNVKPLTGIFVAIGDLLYEFPIGDVFQVVLGINGRLDTYGQLARYSTGVWSSRATSASWTLRLLFAKRL